MFKASKNVPLPGGGGTSYIFLTGMYRFPGTHYHLFLLAQGIKIGLFSEPVVKTCQIRIFC